jgi:polysaccharide pyruvyl transferase WcaK-like protein
MMIAEDQSTEFKEDTVEAHRLSSGASCQSDQKSRRGPRVALLTPYTGGNLGDAAIQDAMIANIRLRLPDAQFSGISLNCDNFVKRHGVGAFPLCATDRSFYGMSRQRVEDEPGEGERSTSRATQKGLNIAAIKRALKSVPGLGRCLKKARAWVTIIPREIRHSVEGYRFLRTQDVLVVSGGGQLDDEWGGPWGHPFTLFKWAVLARIARVPYALASVGASKTTSKTSRLFLSATLRMARYKSYRDKNSREIAAGLLQRTTEDSIVPDLGFSLPSSELPSTAGIRSISRGRPVVAISPIAFAKPGSWPYPDPALYDRYVLQMAQVVSQLLKRGYFLILVWSSEDDKSVIPELLGRLDDEAKNRLAQQMHIPAISTWKDLVASLEDVDCLIASRLHSAILGHVTHKPIIAISFDPKVDWLMEDLSQPEYLLQIRDFTAKDVIEALERIELRRNVVLEQITSYQHRISSVFALQYDALAELIMAARRRSN